MPLLVEMGNSMQIIESGLMTTVHSYTNDQRILDLPHKDLRRDGDEIQVRLQNAILTLPEKQRLVFNMKYNEEMKYEEMSEILGTSVGALKASYHHAVKKIEEFLTKEV